MIRPAALQRDAAARLAAALPDCLASADARNRVAALALSWPGGGLGQIVELRLDGMGAVVDVSQSWLPGALGGLHAAARQDATLAAALPCLGWAAAEGQPRSLWLEWDLDAGAIPGPTAGPSLFLSPPAPPGPGAKFYAQALTHLGAQALLADFASALSALPQGVTLRQIGVMLPRPGPAVRLVLDTGTRAAAEAVVAALCPQHRSALTALFALPGFAAASRLDLDLTPSGIGPRLSLELASLALPGAALRDCLTGLASQGIIDTAAAQALAALAPWQAFGTEGTFGLSHLKASASPGPRIEVKAYLGLIAAPATAPAPTPAQVPAQ